MTCGHLYEFQCKRIRKQVIAFQILFLANLVVDGTTYSSLELSSLAGKNGSDFPQIVRLEFLQQEQH